MTTIISVGVVALLAALCGMLFKKTNGELSLLLSICGAAVIAAAVIPNIETISVWVDSVSNMGTSSEIFAVLLKTLGVSVTGKTVTSLCRDCGESGLAGCVELTAKIMILIIALPMLDDLLAMMEEVLML